MVVACIEGRAWLASDMACPVLAVGRAEAANMFRLMPGIKSSATPEAEFARARPRACTLAAGRKADVAVYGEAQILYARRGQERFA
jgi:hypothetical protein